MAYTKTVWKDYPDTKTKMTAQKLNNIENGIEDVDTRLTTAESDINNVDTRLTTAESDINNVDTRLTTVETGWVSSNETWTYSSVDDPTGVINTSIDTTSKYSEGMRIKFSNNGKTIYGIITKVISTQITFLHEINPSTSQALNLMQNSVITDIYYSTMKAPFGFPLDPNKWSVIYSSTTQFVKSNPVADTWYNSGHKIDVPIGHFRLYLKTVVISARETAGFANPWCALSTSNNSVSHPTLLQGGENNAILGQTVTIDIDDTLYFASKTTLYVICRVISDGHNMLEVGGYTNTGSTTFIKATIAYL